MINRLTDFLFIVLAVLLVFKLNVTPAYNWDMLPYMALVLEHSDDNVESIHREVYNIVLDEQIAGNVTSGTFGELTTDRIAYRAQCYADANTFHNELTYYRAKPLYNAFVYWLYRCGVPIITAVFLPSLIGVLLLLGVLYIWLSVYVYRIIALVITVFVSFLPVFIEVKNSASPDALSALFLLLSLFLYARQKGKWLVLVCALIATLIRVDNFILAGVLTFALFGSTNRKLLVATIVFTLLTIFSLLLIPYLSGNEWTWFRKFKFLESHVQYYFHVRNVFRELPLHPHYFIWIVLGIVLMVQRKVEPRNLMFVILSCVAIRLILFPSLQERFFLAYEFAIIAGLAMMANSVRKYKELENN